MRTLLAFVAGASALVALSAFASNHGLSARGDAGRDPSAPITVTGGTTHQVGISGFTYTPNTLTIAPGDSVSFTASSFHPLRTDDDIFFVRCELHADVQHRRRIPFLLQQSRRTRRSGHVGHHHRAVGHDLPGRLRRRHEIRPWHSA